MRLRSLLALLLTMIAVPASAYVLQTDQDRLGRVVGLRWADSQIRNGIAYWVNPAGFPFSESDVMRVVRNSFEAWESVETASVRFREQGTGGFRVSSRDSRNVVVFDSTGTQIGSPPGSGVIAVTRENWNSRGEILDADIVFNGRDFQFAILENTTPRGRVDLQDVLTHEIGHLLGLDHTPLVGAASIRPTMNPFNTAESPRQARSLELDDRAGVTALYPAPQGNTGTISGRVRHRGGEGAFGVHVVVYQTGTRTFMASALSGSAGLRKGVNGEGGYEISGLPPGAYQVAIEPVSRGITHEHFGGIFNSTFVRSFVREFYDNTALQSAARTIRLAAGETVEGIDFELGLDRAGLPTIADLVLPVSTPNELGPYRIGARIRDDGGIEAADLIYRINGGEFRSRPLGRENGDVYVADLPGQFRGTAIEYRLWARDKDGNQVLYPAAEDSLLRFEVIAFSGHPVLYVAARQAGVVSVFDTGLEREVARIPTGGETPLSVALAGGGRYVFVSNTGPDSGAPDNRVTVIETATHEIVANLEVGLAPLDLAVSKDGRRVYVSNSREKSVSVLDVETLSEVRRLSAPTAGPGPFGIAVSPDGGRIYVTDIDGDQVLILDLESGEVLDRVQVVSAPRSLCVSPDGKRLYVAGFNGGISEVNLERGEVTRLIDTSPAQGVFRVVVSPDGKRLYASDPFDARLMVVDLEGGKLTHRVPTRVGGQNTRDLAVSPDGTRVYATNQDSNDLLIFDSDLVVKAFKIDGQPRGIAVRILKQVRALQADFDSSGRVDFSDFLLFAEGYGIMASDLRFDIRLDLDGNSRVGFADFLLFSGVFGRALNTPP